MQTEQTSHDLLIDEENYVRVSAGKDTWLKPAACIDSNEFFM